MEPKTKLVAIVGPTASGKTELSIKIAQEFNGEIICGDSRTIYKGMDIGTAKPSHSDQNKVIHHCLDLVDPSNEFTVADYKMHANRAISETISRKHLPIIVGGSGMYIDSVLYDYQLSASTVRKISPELSLLQLQKLSSKLGLKPTEQTLLNKQHLKRFIERDGTIYSKKPTNALVLGLEVDKKILQQRIEKRAEKMFKDGLVIEIEALIKKYGKDCRAFMAPGYRAVIGYLEGQYAKSEALELFISADKTLSKRQITWYKNNKDVHWIKGYSQAEQLIKEYLVQ